MTSLMEAFEGNALTIEVREKEYEVLKKEQTTERDQKHLEMAYEWVMRETKESRFYPLSGFGKREIFENREAIGRDWQHLELAYEWLRSRGEMMPSVHKQRISWEPVPGATSYVVYVSKDRTILEPTKFLWEATPGIISKQVTEKTELIIPDEWPDFPMGPGTYHIGITFRDHVGNESGPFFLVRPFKFLAPPAPVKGGIEIL